MITKGSIIKLLKPMPVNFVKVNELCEVVNVGDKGVISFKFGNGKHLGIMTYNEFEEYFTLYEDEKPVKPIRVWSKWKCCGDINIMNDEKIELECRNNNKKVEVRTIDICGGNIKAAASCHNNDKFKFEKGLELAKARLKLKLLKMLF